MEQNKEIAPTESSETPQISMEALEVCKHYLETWSIEETAKATGMSMPEVESLLQKKEVKRYIDHIFIEQGYFNRFKINAVFEEIIKMKLEEMRESEQGSGKDIADLMFMMHKMRMDEMKNMNEREKKESTSQKNVQINNYGDNYNSLVDHLKKKEEKE